MHINAASENIFSPVKLNYQDIVIPLKGWLAQKIQFMLSNTDNREKQFTL